MKNETKYSSQPTNGSLLVFGFISSKNVVKMFVRRAEVKNHDKPNKILTECSTYTGNNSNKKPIQYCLCFIFFVRYECYQLMFPFLFFLVGYLFFCCCHIFICFVAVAAELTILLQIALGHTDATNRFLVLLLLLRMTAVETARD